MSNLNKLLNKVWRIMNTVVFLAVFLLLLEIVVSVKLLGPSLNALYLVLFTVLTNASSMFCLMVLANGFGLVQYDFGWKNIFILTFLAFLSLRLSEVYLSIDPFGYWIVIPSFLLGIIGVKFVKRWSGVFL